MQTFITDFNMAQNARNLDNKRLGKQRVEAIQILNCLLIEESRWKTHPAVKMWKGHEEYLLRQYLLFIMLEWETRGFKNTKCVIRREELYKYFESKKELSNLNNILKPKWLTENFIESHRSNLLRKDYEFYIQKFPDTKLGLEYIWPV